MNFSLVNVALFGVGALLIMSAIKDTNPKEIITKAVASGGVRNVTPPPNAQTGWSIATAPITNPAPGVIVTSP